MATAPISTTNVSSTMPWQWWLSLYSRLSTKGKRGLLIVCLGAAMLAQSVGLKDSTARSDSPYDNPAVQNALHQLKLLAPNDPIGDQFQVNNYTTSYQISPAVSMDSDGDFVVVWMSDGSSGNDHDGFSIQGRRYNSAGEPQGNQFQVNTSFGGNQSVPAVSMDSDGDFVVVWANNGNSIQARVYNSAGIPQGGQFKVNSYNANNPSSPAVSMDSDGDFIVVWHSKGSSGSDQYGFSIQGRRYDSTGVPQGSQFQVNNYTTGNQRYPDVATDSDGTFVIVWDSPQSNGSDTDHYSVHGRRFDSAGIPQGDQFQVNSYTTDIQRFPAVSLDSDGDFVVVWQSNGSYGSDTSFHSIQGQRYNSAGIPQGNQFQVNDYTTSQQYRPAVGFDNDGDFVIVWQSSGSYGNDTSFQSVQGQAYNSAGVPQSSQFQVNSYTTSSQRKADIGLDSDGNFVVVWESYGSDGNDTSYSSIQGQRFGTGSVTPTPTSTATPTNTPSPTGTPTPSATPTDTPSPTHTLPPTATSTPIITPTNTPKPTSTLTPSPIPTNTPSPTVTSVNSPTPTISPTATSIPIGWFSYLPAIVSDSYP